MGRTKTCSRLIVGPYCPWCHVRWVYPKILGFWDPPLKEVGRKADDVEIFFKKGPVARYPDFGLEKRSIFAPSEWDLVAVFFGSIDNSEDCQFARIGIEKNGGEYRCRQLNK